MNRFARSFGTLAAASAIAFVAAVAQPRAAAASDRELCAVRPMFCATLTVTVIGDASGTAQSEDPSTGWDGWIRCVRSAGVTTGTCSHRYYVGTGRVVRVTLYPRTIGVDLACLEICPWPSQILSTDIVLSPNVNRTVVTAFVQANPQPTDSISPPPPTLDPPTAQPTVQPTPMPTAAPTKPPHGGGKPTKAPHPIAPSNASTPTPPTPVTALAALGMVAACGIGFMIAFRPRRR